MLGKIDEAVEGEVLDQSGQTNMPSKPSTPVDLKEILKLQPNNIEALSELELIRPKHGTGRGGASSSLGAQDKIGTSSWRKLPFELHEVDFTPIRLASTKRSLPNTGRGSTSRESYIYASWNAYEIQMAV